MSLERKVKKVYLDWLRRKRQLAYRNVNGKLNKHSKETRYINNEEGD